MWEHIHKETRRKAWRTIRRSSVEPSPNNSRTRSRVYPRPWITSGRKPFVWNCLFRRLRHPADAETRRHAHTPQSPRVASSVHFRSLILSVRPGTRCHLRRKNKCVYWDVRSGRLSVRSFMFSTRVPFCGDLFCKGILLLRWSSNQRCYLCRMIAEGWFYLLIS